MKRIYYLKRVYPMVTAGMCLWLVPVLVALLVIVLLFIYAADVPRALIVWSNVAIGLVSAVCLTGFLFQFLQRRFVYQSFCSMGQGIIYLANGIGPSGLERLQDKVVGSLAKSNVLGAVRGALYQYAPGIKVPVDPVFCLFEPKAGSEMGLGGALFHDKRYKDRVFVEWGGNPERTVALIKHKIGHLLLNQYDVWDDDKQHEVMKLAGIDTLVIRKW